MIGENFLGPHASIAKGYGDSIDNEGHYLYREIMAELSQNYQVFLQEMEALYTRFSPREQGTKNGIKIRQLFEDLKKGHPLNEADSSFLQALSQGKNHDRHLAKMLIRAQVCCLSFQRAAIRQQRQIAPKHDKELKAQLSHINDTLWESHSLLTYYLSFVPVRSYVQAEKEVKAAKAAFTKEYPKAIQETSKAIESISSNEHKKYKKKEQQASARFKSLKWGRSISSEERKKECINIVLRLIDWKEPAQQGFLQNNPSIASLANSILSMDFDSQPAPQSKAFAIQKLLKDHGLIEAIEKFQKWDASKKTSKIFLKNCKESLNARLSSKSTRASKALEKISSSSKGEERENIMRLKQTLADLSEGPTLSSNKFSAKFERLQSFPGIVQVRRISVLHQSAGISGKISHLETLHHLTEESYSTQYYIRLYNLFEGLKIHLRQAEDLSPQVAAKIQRELDTFEVYIKKHTPFFKKGMKGISTTEKKQKVPVKAALSKKMTELLGIAHSIAQNTQSPALTKKVIKDAEKSIRYMANIAVWRRGRPTLSSVTYHTKGINQGINLLSDFELLGIFEGNLAQQPPWMRGLNASEAKKIQTIIKTNLLHAWGNTPLPDCFLDIVRSHLHLMGKADSGALNALFSAEKTLDNYLKITASLNSGAISPLGQAILASAGEVLSTAYNAGPNALPEELQIAKKFIASRRQDPSIFPLSIKNPLHVYSNTPLTLLSIEQAQEYLKIFDQREGKTPIWFEKLENCEKNHLKTCVKEALISSHTSSMDDFLGMMGSLAKRERDNRENIAPFSYTQEGIQAWIMHYFSLHRVSKPCVRDFVKAIRSLPTHLCLDKHALEQYYFTHMLSLSPATKNNLIRAWSNEGIDAFRRALSDVTAAQPTTIRRYPGIANAHFVRDCHYDANHNLLSDKSNLRHGVLDPFQIKLLGSGTEKDIARNERIRLQIQNVKQLLENTFLEEFKVAMQSAINNGKTVPLFLDFLESKYGQWKDAAGNIQIPLLIQLLVNKVNPPIPDYVKEGHLQDINQAVLQAFYKLGTFQLHVGDETLTIGTSNFIGTIRPFSPPRNIGPADNPPNKHARLKLYDIAEKAMRAQAGSSSSNQKILTAAYQQYKELTQSGAHVWLENNWRMTLPGGMLFGSGAMLAGIRGKYQPKRNRNIRLAALEQIIMAQAGGIAAGSCKSGKDRKGIEQMYTAAMMEFFYQEGKFPDYKNTEEQKLLANIFAKIFISGFQQQSASAAAPGAEGIKVLKKVLPKCFLSAIAEENEKQLGKEPANHESFLAIQTTLSGINKFNSEKKPPTGLKKFNKIAQKYIFYGGVSIAALFIISLTLIPGVTMVASGLGQAWDNRKARNRGNKQVRAMEALSQGAPDIPEFPELPSPIENRFPPSQNHLQSLGVDPLTKRRSLLSAHSRGKNSMVPDSLKKKRNTRGSYQKRNK